MHKSGEKTSLGTLSIICGENVLYCTSEFNKVLEPQQSSNGAKADHSLKAFSRAISSFLNEIVEPFTAYIADAVSTTHKCI